MWSSTGVTLIGGILVTIAATLLPVIDGSDSEYRIVGGFPAIQQSTVHQVSIRRKSNDEALFGSGHMCGGSLINNRTVLTAAHCLVDDNDRKRSASYFRVVGGSLNRIQISASTEIRDVSKVIVHERYDGRNFDNDVGILILSSPIPSDHPSLRPINLVYSPPNVGVVCQTSGWGTTRYGVASATVELLAVNITVQSTEICNGTNSYRGGVRPGMLCVGEMAGGRDACQGDSGGPLVCDGLLAGIVSNGNGCAQPNFPGLYADVAYYRQWIAKNDARRAGTSLVSLCLVIVGLLKGILQQTMRG